MTDACDLSAVDARRLIAQRQLSPVELLESCLSRIEQVNPAVNAIVTLAKERARTEARAAEEAVIRGAPLGLLHGLPAAIKDLNETAGIRTTFGSPLHRDHVPVEDDVIVARLRQQGTVVLGKTNAPEFGIGSNTTNPVFGPTGNPFQPSLTCGGSSGGAGVALATSMVPIANGSDSGASIRNPAAFCGIVGLRPTPGLVSNPRRALSLSTSGVQGPMGRTVGDVALLLAAMAEHDPGDMLSHPVDPLSFLDLRRLDPSSLRVGFSEDFGFAPVDQAVRETFRRRIADLAPHVAACDPVEFRMATLERAYWGIRALYLVAGSHERFLTHGEALGRNMVDNMQAGLAMSAADIAWAAAEQGRIARDFQFVFDHHDIIVTPAANVMPFSHALDHPETLDGRAARHYAEWYSISYAVTTVAHPAIAMPAGLDAQGTPFGLQVIGRRHQDKRLLEVALALESLFASLPGTHRPVPNLEALASAPPLGAGA